MDVLDIFDAIDICGKTKLLADSDAGFGNCSSCTREQQLIRRRGELFCLACASINAACPSKKRFSGALFADVNGAIEWVFAPEMAHGGPDVRVEVRDDWLAAAFTYAYRHDTNDPYVFGINTTNSIFELSNLFLNSGGELIRISGPVSPVVPYVRDARWVTKGAIRKQLTEEPPDRPRTPAERFVSVMANLNINDKKQRKGLAAWIL